MAIKLIIDSASDISEKHAEELGIIMLPMPVTIGEKQYLSGVDITPKEFYELLIETDSMPVTSQVPPYAFEEAYKKVLEKGDTPIVITISSKLSGTYQSACIAAENAGGEVYIIDSMSAALGEAILVYHAKELADSGLPAGEIAEKLEEVKKRIKLIALLDTLEYLKKGGRISAATAMVGGLLSIKPVISIDAGEVKLIGKARGSKQGNNFLNEMIKNGKGIDFDMPYTLAYTGLSDALLQKYIVDSQELWRGHTDKLPVMEIGATIGTHAGPGAIAVAYFDK